MAKYRLSCRLAGHAKLKKRAESNNASNIIARVWFERGMIQRESQTVRMLMLLSVGFANGSSAMPFDTIWAPQPVENHRF